MTFSISDFTHILAPHLSVRHASLEDVEAVAQLLNDHSIAVSGQPDTNVDELLSEWESPNFNIETDAIVVTTESERIVGYISVWNILPPYVRNFAFGCTHTDYYGQGIGTMMLRWAEAHARQNLHKAQPDARVDIDVSFNAVEEEPRALLLNEGYSLIRHFWQMKINLTEEPPAPTFPDHITIRTLADGVSLRDMIATSDEAFEDHWGHVPTSLDSLVERWEHWLANDPDQDPAMWYAAMDGDQMAAICLCADRTTQDPDMGYVNVLGVRRPWRKQGLGRALLYLSFGEFYRRDRASVGLSVDAGSLTGATRLYESVGMHRNKQWDAYRKTLRDGIDLTTQSVD